MPYYFLVSPLHDAVLLTGVGRGQQLLDSCHPQELLYDLVVESCSAIRVNHVGATEAAEMLEDA